MAVLHIPNGLPNFLETVAPADDRSNLSGVHELSQGGQLRVGYFRPNHSQSLADQARQHRRLHQASQNSNHPAAASIRRSDHDVASLGIEDAPESGQGMVRNTVEN